MGNELRRLLKARKLTQKAFAKKIGRSEGVVNRWVSYQYLSVDAIWTILSFFELPPTDFFPINEDKVHTEEQITELYKNQRLIKEALQFLITLSKDDPSTVPWEHINPEIGALLLKLEGKLRQ